MRKGIAPGRGSVFQEPSDRKPAGRMGIGSVELDSEPGVSRREVEGSHGASRPESSAAGVLGRLPAGASDNRFLAGPAQPTPWSLSLYARRGGLEGRAPP